MNLRYEDPDYFIDCYYLDGKQFKKCKTLSDFDRAFKLDNRRIKHTKINGTLVSTVFLVLDHNFEKKDDPILFETMTFPDQDICRRYRTFEEAVKGHDQIVETIRKEARKNE